MNVYTYQVDLFGPQGWHTAEVEEREFASDPAEAARGLAQDWILDHPETVHGGERVQVHAGDPGEPPVDGFVSVRLLVYRGPLDAHDPAAAAVADLVYDETEH